MTYDWLSPDQIEELVNPVLEKRGMALLNINMEYPTCRVLGAWDNGHLVSFFAVQLFPVLGPMVKADSLHRDNGEVSRELASRMHAFLDENEVRGYMVVADNPITGRLCERHGMMKMASPVYMADGWGLECNDYISPTEVQ